LKIIFFSKTQLDHNNKLDLNLQQPKTPGYEGRLKSNKNSFDFKLIMGFWVNVLVIWDHEYVLQNVFRFSFGLLGQNIIKKCIISLSKTLQLAF
jgi:hypothetical protein